MFRVVLAVAVLALSGPSFAQEKSVFVTGMGQKFCADFLNASAGLPFGQYGATRIGSQEMVSENRAYQQWAFGFIVASALHTDKQVSGDYNARMDAELRNYCSANPSSKFLTAVMDFMKRNER